MNEQQKPNPMMQQEEEPINLYAIIFKYLVYWPWFLVSVLICVLLVSLVLPAKATADETIKVNRSSQLEIFR